MYDEYNKPDPSLVVMRDIPERVAICFAVVVSLLALGITAVVMEIQRKKNAPSSAARSVVNLGIASSQSEQKDGLLSLASSFMEDEDWGAASACYSKLLDLEENATSRFSYLFNRGIANARQGELEQAKLDLEDATDIRSDVVGCYLNLAWIADQQNDPRTFVNNFQEVIRLSPQDPRGYGNLARLAFTQGEFRTSVDLLSHAIRLAPNDPVLRINRAIALGKLKRFDAAIGDLEQVSVKEYSNEQTVKLSALMQMQAGRAEQALRTISLHRHEWEDTAGLSLLALSSLENLNGLEDNAVVPENFEQEEYQKLRSVFHKELAKSETQIASSIEDMLRLEDAFQPFELCASKLVGLNYEFNFDAPEKVGAMALGQTFIEQGDIYSAIACFTEAIRIGNQITKSYQERALAFINLGEYDRAVEDLQQLVSINPEDAEIWTLMGIASTRQQDFAAAVKCLDQAVRLSPDNWVAYLNRGKINFLNEDFAAVIKDCERAKERGGNSAELFDLEARAYAETGVEQAAVLSHEKALSLSSRDHEYLLNYVKTLELFQHYKQALDLLGPVAKVSKEPVIWSASARCFFHQEQYSKAADAARAAVSFGATEAETALLLARSLYAIGQLAESLQAYADVPEGVATASDQKNQFIALATEGRHQEALAFLASCSIDEDSKLLKLALKSAQAMDDVQQEYEFLSRLAEQSDGNISDEQLLHVATLCQELGNWRESFVRLNEILQSAPENPEVWFLLGTYYEHESEAVSAIKSFSRALAIDAEHFASRLGRARVLIANEDFGNALSDLQVLRATDQEDQETRKLIALCMQSHQR